MLRSCLFYRSNIMSQILHYNQILNSIQICKITVIAGLGQILQSPDLVSCMEAMYDSTSLRVVCIVPQALQYTFHTCSMEYLPNMYAGIYCTPSLSNSGGFTYSGWEVCAWKITSHVEIISIAFRGYVNLIFICINFLLIMSKDCGLIS